MDNFTREGVAAVVRVSKDAGTFLERPHPGQTPVESVVSWWLAGATEVMLWDRPSRTVRLPNRFDDALTHRELAAELRQQEHDVQRASDRFTAAGWPAEPVRLVERLAHFTEAAVMPEVFGDHWPPPPGWSEAPHKSLEEASGETEHEALRVSSDLFGARLHLAAGHDLFAQPPSEWAGQVPLGLAQSVAADLGLVLRKAQVRPDDFLRLLEIR